MEKIEHIALMLNRRTKGKKYENFIINSLYSKLSNPELIPVTQQYVKSNKNKYYLMDLYFPQLNYGVEVDENHHLNKENTILDNIRAEDILSSIECEQGRITLFNENNSLKSYDEVNNQINDQVKIISRLIREKEEETGNKLHWEDNNDRKKQILTKGIFDINDEADYEGVTEIYNILGNKVKNLGRCFVNLNKNYKLWVAYLAIQMEDGTVKTKNGWENTLIEDRIKIKEVVGNMEKCDTKNIPEGNWNEGGYKRIVFMHIKDSFGMDRVKFLGVYQAYKILIKGGNQERFYKRVATEFNFKMLNNK